MKTYTTPDGNLLPEAFVNAYIKNGVADKPLSTVLLADGMTIDIEKAPHILIAGATGSGKSVTMHNIICSLLINNTTEDCQMLLIDPKRVEFKYFYDKNPILFCPVVTDPKEALVQLQKASQEMMRRYDIMEQQGLRFWNGKKLYIVIDEIADLVSEGGKVLESVIEKISRLGRGAGLHLIVATQHPTCHVLSRQITTNLDVRICLKVNDASASRLVLGVSGGEKLKGKGDSIIRMNGEYIRYQGLYIDDNSLESFSHSWKVEGEEEQPKTYTTAPKQAQAAQPKQKGFFSLLGIA